MSLQELQSQVKPLTLPDMLMLKAKAEQDAVDKTKILYEQVFQQRIIPLLTHLIKRRGVDTVFGFDINCAYSFGKTQFLNSENPKYTKELFQGFTDYVGERVKTVFPDYNAKLELKIERVFNCWGVYVYKLETVLIRKDTTYKTA
jgi:hypothetical protein